MGILDQLVEKKHILIYIRVREAQLRDAKIRVVTELPPKKRQWAVLRIEGRLAELKQLRKEINSVGLRDYSILHWSAVRLPLEEFIDGKK